MRPAAIALFACTLLVPGLRGQAPRITPAGDPSVRNDTIYGLAVDPAAHPDEAFIYLLDDGVIRVEQDGRDRRTFRQVIQILTQEGAEAWGELSFPYSAGSQRLTVNWARVMRPTGEVVSGRPVHQQESIAPVAREAPVYSDARIRQASLGGVAPGTIVDWSYTIETARPAVPGDFRYVWLVTMGVPTRRSRFVLDVPAALTPRIKEANLTFRRRVAQANGRRVHTWATAELPKIEPEPFAADSNGVVQHITVSAPRAWGEVARWYAGLARDRYALTPALDSALAAVVAGAPSLDDSLRAVHRWVAQDFRYVSLSLGAGGYQPRHPGAVLETRYGDCKDKTTLFIALAHRLGARAYPVLLSADGGVDRNFPSVYAFDHAIAALERAGGYVYLDLTAGLVPFGELPFAQQGGFALVVHPDGRAEEVTLPEAGVQTNRTRVLMEGALSPEGLFSGRLTMTTAGAPGAELRNLFVAPWGTAERQRFARGWAARFYPGGDVDSLEIFDGKDLRAEARVSVVLQGARAASETDEGHILKLPSEGPPASDYLAQLEAASGPRRFPIDAAKVVGPMELATELRVALPEGWRARLPRGVTAASDFGRYAAEYSQEGRVLRVVHRVWGMRGVHSPERLGDLIGWLKEVSRDDVHVIMIAHSR